MADVCVGQSNPISSADVITPLTMDYVGGGLMDGCSELEGVANWWQNNKIH